jgi:hypothetical protein
MADEHVTDPQATPVELITSAGIGRRAWLQTVAGGIGATLAVPGLADAQHPVHQHLADQSKTSAAAKKAAAAAYKPEFLDAHQLATLESLAERIVPGSTKAKVAPFIDQLVAVDSPANQKTLLGALGAFDMLAIEQHRKPWKALTAAEQDALLTTASTTEAARRGQGPDDDPRAPMTASGKATIRDHFEGLKGWISGAYYSSEIGMRELGWTGEMFFQKLPGCEHPDGHA